MDDLISRQAAIEASDAQPESTRTFVDLVVEYPDPELCTYKEYKGKPYYSIKYIENGETYVGYGTYNPEVLSQYLKEYFMPSAQPERKGKWVGVGYDGDWLKTMCKCSKCGAMIDINEKYRNFFCYHCGARMDGEQDG